MKKTNKKIINAKSGNEAIKKFNEKFGFEPLIVYAYNYKSQTNSGFCNWICEY